MREEKLKLIVFTGMLTALTFVATFIIKLPSPTGGYIHPGDVPGKQVRYAGSTHK